MVHVPCKGAPPAMTDLLAGQVALTFATRRIRRLHQGRGREMGESGEGLRRAHRLTRKSLDTNVSGTFRN